MNYGVQIIMGPQAHYISINYGLQILMGHANFYELWAPYIDGNANFYELLAAHIGCGSTWPNGNPFSQIVEVKQRRARLVLGWVTESRCWPFVEVLGKPVISRRLCPPSSDGHLVERES